jgi:RNA polymerase sigma factor for flagellar operon FliA
VQRERTDSLLGEQKKPAPGLAGMLELVIGIALTYQIDELLEVDEPNLQHAGEPYASRSYDEMQGRLKEVLAQLPERERKIIHYHYFHQIAFDEIAVLLELTKSRVSQLHKRAIGDIREALRKARLSEFY